MVKVQFPESEDNFYWDGKVHMIEPHNLACIENSNYYYMDGYDYSFGFEMMTLLREENQKFTKVPLNDYEDFNQLVIAANLEFISPTVLGDKIELDPIMTVNELRQKLGIIRRVRKKD